MIVPQRSVQQGAKGHFVWVVTKEGTADYRPVTVGEWQENNWFISEGLSAGDQVVVDGSLTLRPGAQVKIKPLSAQPPVSVNQAGTKTSQTSSPKKDK